jgi:hypothetical protein
MDSMRKILSLFCFLIFAFFAKASPPSGYVLVFDQEFKTPLSISNYGPGTTWIAHTPYGGDFGYAWFGIGPQISEDPVNNNGNLILKAWWDVARNHWHSGFVSSVDTNGNGFSQELGYWEARLKWPGGLGTWPAFWLDGVNGIGPHTTNVAEIDIFEGYGSTPTSAHQNIHVWSPSGSQLSASGHIQAWGNLTSINHIFGCLVNKDYIHFYLDGYEIWNIPTPPEATLPLYCMLDLALYSATAGTPNPSYMYIDYVRCYAPPQ